MDIGVFAKIFARESLEAVLDAVVGHGFDHVQFNLVCAGLPSMPDRIETETAKRIEEAFRDRHLGMAAVSGTFNMVDPDPTKRKAGLGRLRVLAAECARWRTSIITLSTGTRDPEYLWRGHPDNGSPRVWRDLLGSMAEAVETAEEFNVTLAFEPEIHNVVDSAQRARLLLDEIQSPRLKVVLDGANLFHKQDLPRMSEILAEAFNLLGSDIVLAHAKDLGPEGDVTAAGRGLLDYGKYLSLLNSYGFPGALILHGLAEAEVGASAAFLRRRLAGVVGGQRT